MEKKELKKLGEDIILEDIATKHAEYIGELLLRELKNKMELCKEFFIHGYKHGKKDTAHNRSFIKSKK